MDEGEEEMSAIRVPSSGTIKNSAEKRWKCVLIRVPQRRERAVTASYRKLEYLSSIDAMLVFSLPILYHGGLLRGRAGCTRCLWIRRIVVSHCRHLHTYTAVMLVYCKRVPEKGKFVPHIFLRLHKGLKIFGLEGPAANGWITTWISQFNERYDSQTDTIYYRWVLSTLQTITSTLCWPYAPNTE